MERWAFERLLRFKLRRYRYAVPGMRVFPDHMYVAAFFLRAVSCILGVQTLSENPFTALCSTDVRMVLVRWLPTVMYGGDSWMWVMWVCIDLCRLFCISPTIDAF